MALGWLIRFLIAMVVIRLAWKFLGGVVEGATSRPQVPPSHGVPLVRDPVCGTYVDRARALTARSRHGVQYFCCEDCRTTYRQGARATASGQ